MDAYLDELLDKLVAAEPREAWNDVLHRARRTHRLYVGAAAGVGALVLAPAGWAIQRALVTALPAAPPAYQPGDTVWTATPPIALTTTTIHCDSIDDAANLLTQLESEGAPVNDVECSNTPAGPTSPTAPAPYQPGDPVVTSG